jgi:hypothetical protein
MIFHLFIFKFKVISSSSIFYSEIQKFYINYHIIIIQVDIGKKINKNLKARAINRYLRIDIYSLFNEFSGSGYRLSPLTTPPCERSPHMTLSLQEILIVGSASEQAKFSELTMDMFR